MNLTSIVLYITGLVLSYMPIPNYAEGVIDQPRSFLPSKAATQHEKTVSSLIYRGLFKYDIYGSLVPDLAETWETQENGLVYQIKIRGDSKWSDGRKITADDLIYTAAHMADLTGVATDKVDELTVRYVLPNKYAPFLSLLTNGIMPVNAENKGYQLSPISNSDFRVVRVDRGGHRIKGVVLVTDSDKYKIKKIHFKYYSNEPELVTASKLGEIDGFLAQKSHDDLTNLNDQKFPLQGIYYALYFNLRNEAYKDLAFRQKLEKALPLDQIVFDRGISVEGPVSRGSYTDRNLKYDKYDSKLKEDNNGKKVKLTVPDTDKHVEVALRVADFWSQALDIDTEIIKVDPAEFTKKVIEPRDFEIVLYGQEVGRDPDRYVNWHSTQKDAPGINITGFEQVRADRALEEGRNELNNDKRVVHYNEFQKTVLENTPAIFLYHPFVNYYISKYITGLGEKYTYNYADRFLDFYNWTRVQTN